MFVLVAQDPSYETISNYGKRFRSVKRENVLERDRRHTARLPSCMSCPSLVIYDGGKLKQANGFFLSVGEPRNYMKIYKRIPRKQR